DREEEDESRNGGFVRIEEELKAGEYSASIAYSAPIDVQRADRCDDRCNESIGRYDRYSPTVTQGVVAGLRPNWYNLFQVALQAYFLSI
ncbi:hypothetical protein L249_7883, partial [Ophiocordyceps polyrhachis-furcata BCC 54312]